MKVNNLSPSFTGYSNIIASELRFEQERHLFMTMQLDDIGTPDLTEYKNLRRMQGLPEQKINNPVLTVMFSDVPPNLKYYFLNDMRMHTGESLRLLQEKSVTQYSMEMYKGEEKLHLRAYTFLANITRRLMSDNFAKETAENSDIVKNSAENILAKIFQNKKAAKEFMSITLDGENLPCQIIAKKINDKIARTMHVFFK